MASIIWLSILIPYQIITISVDILLIPSVFLFRLAWTKDEYFHFTKKVYLVF